MTPKDIRDIAAAMMREAKKGNPKAAQWVGDRIFGKPPQSIDLSAQIEQVGTIKLKWSDDVNRPG